MSRYLAAMATIALFVSGSVARAEDAQKAKEAFQRGTTLYDVGQFDKAIEAWQEGYKEKADPAFLYNIAQAYRQQGDAAKAIFFYKGFLRNSPKAHNRAEIEQKIEALQKQLADQERAKISPAPVGGLPGSAEAKPAEPTAGGAMTGPPAFTGQASGAGAPPPSSGTSNSGPPSNEAAPAVTVTGVSGAAGGPPPAATGAASGSGAAVTTEVESGEREAASARRVSFLALTGADVWSSGPRTSADPSFALTIGGGYSFGAPDARFRFRLGARFGYTFLSEPNGRDTFTSFTVDPGVEVQLTPSARWYLDADLGLGVLAIAGIKSNSVLLLQSNATDKYDPNGTLGLGMTRLAVSLEYRLLPDVAVVVAPAVSTAKKQQYMYKDITRLELLAGVAVRAF